MEQLAGSSSVSVACGHGGAGGAGNDGRDAVDHRYLWNGGVLGEQAAAGVGNPRGARRTANGTVAGGVGTRRQITRIWFRRWIAPGNSGEPGSGFHRVSGDSARSAGA